MKTQKMPPQHQESLSEKPSYRCTEIEHEEAREEAQRRGMTFSQLVRLAVNSEVKRGGK